MNRRMAMMLTLLSGGLLLPTKLLAQQARSARDDEEDTPRSSTSGGFKRPKGGIKTARRDVDDEDTSSSADEVAAPAEEISAPPVDFKNEPGQSWRTYDINRYTSLSHTNSNPQTAIVEWIFRRTGSAAWHGDKIAVLSASRTQIRAYHSNKYLKQVQDVIDRFSNQQVPDVLKMRVRFVSAADTRWRYAVASRLNPVGSGPQGQQIWTLRSEDAAMVRTQMSAYQGFTSLADQELKLVNGQTLTVKTTKPIDYIVGPERDAAVGLGFQPGTAQLEEGVTLRLSPLLNYEGDAVDAAIDLRANTVKAFHRTKIMTRREIGPADMTIDVPEVVESRLNQTVQGWPLGQTLLISAGIQPGILQSKGGLFNMRIPGTVPTSTELLIFLDLETVGENSKPTKSQTKAQTKSKKKDVEKDLDEDVEE